MLAAAAVLWWTTRPPALVPPCPVLRGPVSLPDLPEASGLAISRRTPGLIWAHNDSGNPEILFALDASGAVRGRVRVPIHARDWEDVSAAPCASGNCLYVADIGDNALLRRRLAVYRVPEPSPGDAQTAPPDQFSVYYPDGPHNAEAAFLVEGRFFVVTKDRTGGLYRSASRLDSAGDVMLERIGELGLLAVTDAETSPDGAVVVVRTPHDVAYYRAAELARGRVNPRARVRLDGLAEPQGEGVALAEDGTLYLASEGRPWTRGGSLVVLRCATLSSQTAEKPL